MGRRAARIDDNQTEIVRAFVELGYSVAVTSDQGSGFPDIVVGKFKRNYLIEIKDGSKPLSRRKLTAYQQKFRDGWAGQYSVIESIDDVVAFDLSVCSIED